MKWGVNELLNEFGFCGFKSFYESLVAPKYGMLFITVSSFGAFAEQYFGMCGACLILLLVLVKIELLTGIWASVKAKRKIVSKKLQRFILKIMIYFLFIMVFHILGQNTKDFTGSVYRYMHSFTIFYFIFVHVKSISENYGAITGKKSEFLELVRRMNKLFFKVKDEDPK